MYNAIWRVDARWFATRKEATAFCEGANKSESEIVRVQIGQHINAEQLVSFLKANFVDGILKV